MNKILMLVGIAIAAVAVWLLLSRDKGAPTAKAADQAGSSTSGTTPTAPATKPAPVGKVGRVSPEERKRLAEQIANAKAKRAAQSSGGGTSSSPAGPRPELPAAEDVKVVRTTMKDAMREVIPFLADCYDKAGQKVPTEIKVVAEITLTGDPDIGTIIDTNSIADESGAPLEPSFDLCMQDALASLQMPPLSEGGEVKVRYPFLFARSDEPAGSGNP